MTEEEVANLGETTPEGGGTGVQPKTDVSPAKEQDSPSAESLVATLRENPEFTSWIDSRFQSWKDKRLDKHETELGDMKSELAGYRKLKEEIEAIKSKGFTEEQAEFLIEQRESGKPVPQKTSPGTTDSGASDFNVDSLYKSQGLDPNAPDVLELVRKGADLLQHVSHITAVKSKPVQPPNPAQVMPTGTGTTDGRSLEVVTAELNEAISDSRGINFDRVRKLEEEHKALLRKL